MQVLGAAAIQLNDMEVASDIFAGQIRDEILIWLGIFIGFCVCLLLVCLFLLTDDFCKEKHLKERFVSWLKGIFRR